MYPQNYSQQLFNAITPVAITSSTDATPIVITATAHGLVTGDRVAIQGHATNIAANGIYKVTRLSANTFSLQDEFSGADVAGSGAGAGSGGVMVKAPPVALVTGFRNLELQVGTTGTATMTLGVFGSLGKLFGSATPRGPIPNMGATVSPSNPWSLMQVIDLDTGAAINGATGIIIAGADINKMFEINVNGATYVTVLPLTWSAGALSVKGAFTTQA